MTDKEAIDKLLDENNNDNVILYDDKNNPIEFAQVAVIPLNQDTYFVLKPVSELEGVEDDEVIIFKFVEDEEEDHLEVSIDDKINNKVLDELNRLIKDK